MPMRFAQFRPRHVLAAWCLSAAVVAATQVSGNEAPLPNPDELLQRAIANEKKLAAEQERYECRVADEATELDKNGRVKKTTTEVDEQFYVNGVSIERTLSKNGKDLSPGEARKENERVMKATLKYSNPATAQKENDKNNQQAQDLMEAMMLTHGRREIENGRSILYYDIVPNPKFHPKNLTQHFATVMNGMVSVDEKSGELIDVNMRSVSDLKIGGGLLANLHKGFWLHIHNHEEPDGVWLTDLAEGSGDARAALFFHPYFRFKETTGDCHLYNAVAQQVGPVTAVK